MNRRLTIRSDSLWLRLLCTLTVGVGAWNLDHFRILSRTEEAFRNIIVDGESLLYGRCSGLQSSLLILVMVIILTLPRLERPFLMLVFTLLTWATYAVTVVVIPIGWNFILPITAPALLIVGAMALRGTLAWQEERSGRLHTENLNRSRQLLVDMLVHDIRQRSATVLSSLALYKQKGPDSTTMTLIQTGIERILILVGNLMDVRKADQGPLNILVRPLDPVLLIRESIEDHQAAAELVQVSLRVHGESGLMIMGDADLLRRVLTNLIWNALQHAPAGSPVEISCVRGKGAIEIRVYNQGAVIPPAEQALLFVPFAAGQSKPAHPTSTGLGLVFCKHAMDAHGGSIRVESPPAGRNEGVEVCLLFPVDA